MPRFIAFLRAINVGGHMVKMDRLRKLFEALGFSHVETFIASGNVIFESPETNTHVLEEQIERHLRQALGYEVKTFIRTPSEVAAITQYRPFASDAADGGEHALYIAFLPASPTGEARDKLMAFRSAIDDFDVYQREIYWQCRTRISESRFSGALLERTIGMSATMRNSTTVRKLAAKYSDA